MTIEQLMNASQYWAANDSKHFVRETCNKPGHRKNQPRRSMFQLISRTDMDAPAICHESTIRGSRGHERSALAALIGICTWTVERARTLCQPVETGCWDTRFLMKAVLPDGSRGA
jgi:hypothetical protein